MYQTGRVLMYTFVKGKKSLQNQFILFILLSIFHFKLTEVTYENIIYYFSFNFMTIGDAVRKQNTRY